MDIVVHKEKIHTINISQIKEGCCFKYGGEYYMRLAIMSKSKINNELFPNAVNIKDGRIEPFKSTVQVIPIYATVCIEE